MYNTDVVGVWLKALTYGVDFFAAEGYLDMVAAHKHRKRVSGKIKGGGVGRFR